MHLLHGVIHAMTGPLNCGPLLILKLIFNLSSGNCLVLSRINYFLKLHINNGHSVEYHVIQIRVWDLIAI